MEVLTGQQMKEQLREVVESVKDGTMGVEVAKQVTNAIGKNIQLVIAQCTYNTKFAKDFDRDFN